MVDDEARPSQKKFGNGQMEFVPGINKMYHGAGNRLHFWTLVEETVHRSNVTSGNLWIGLCGIGGASHMVVLVAIRCSSSLTSVTQV